ncbi:dsRBD fold-containing protein [Nonomuraea sp. NPDC048901]|uniref:dsRBD fold-containing protein n=1 Tax=unclassified Nonomuraea TaxID=2593643 RepID=UPI0033D903F3
MTRDPAEPAEPEIGDELATSRALADLAERLALVTQHDITELADLAVPSRTW